MYLEVLLAQSELFAPCVPRRLDQADAELLDCMVDIGPLRDGLRALGHEEAQMCIGEVEPSQNRAIVVQLSPAQGELKAFPVQGPSCEASVDEILNWVEYTVVRPDSVRSDLAMGLSIWSDLHPLALGPAVELLFGRTIDGWTLQLGPEFAMVMGPAIPSGEVEPGRLVRVVPAVQLAMGHRVGNVLLFGRADPGLVWMDEAALPEVRVLFLARVGFGAEAQLGDALGVKVSYLLQGPPVSLQQSGATVWELPHFTANLGFTAAVPKRK